MDVGRDARAGEVRATAGLGRVVVFVARGIAGGGGLSLLPTATMVPARRLHCLLCVLGVYSIGVY